ncbi:hypothetical protein D3C73_1219320 [compost metagenome]
MVIDDLFDSLKYLVKERIGKSPLIRIIRAKSDGKGFIEGQSPGYRIGDIVVLLHDSFDFQPRLFRNVTVPVDHAGNRRLVHARQIGDFLNRYLGHLLNLSYLMQPVA